MGAVAGPSTASVDGLVNPASLVGASPPRFAGRSAGGQSPPPLVERIELHSRIRACAGPVFRHSAGCAEPDRASTRLPNASCLLRATLVCLPICSRLPSINQRLIAVCQLQHWLRTNLRLLSRLSRGPHFSSAGQPRKDHHVRDHEPWHKPDNHIEHSANIFGEIIAKALHGDNGQVEQPKQVGKPNP